MVGLHLPPLVEGAEGITLFENGMILIREEYDFFESTMSKSDKLTERELALIITLNHEGVHFFGSFTQSFPYSYMMNLKSLCARLMNLARKGLLNAAKLRSFREAYESYNRLLTNREYGLSAMDLLEAMAVTESFRSTYLSNPTISNFVYVLKKFYPDENSSYRRAIDLVGRNFGIEAALDLTPRLCFLALNGDNPGKSFQTFIEWLKEEHIVTYQTLKAVDLCAIFQMEPENSWLPSVYRQFPEEDRISFLTPYFEKLLTLGTIDELFEYAAHPGDLAKGTNPEFGHVLLPPALMFSNGKSVYHGLGKLFSKDDLFFYLDWAALTGACQRLLLEDEYYQCCPHTSCPIHKTNLCFMWYAVPQNIPWSDCAFPKRLKVQFGMDAETLMQVRTESFE